MRPRRILLLALAGLLVLSGWGARSFRASRRQPNRPFDGTSEAPAPSPSEPVPRQPDGEELQSEASLLFRVVACTGEEPLPASFDASILEEHCAWLAPILARYRTEQTTRVEPFFAARRPAALPPRVVYPFGGGDLLSALAVYPDAAEYTTLSLEHAGDPRRLRGLDTPRLARSLAEVRRRTRGLFAHAESTSENLMQLQRGDLPGQLCFFLLALAAHGFEPVSLRYFQIEPDGSLSYLDREGLARLEADPAPRLSAVWKAPDFSAAFANSELVFRKVGRPEDRRVHRHIAVNLSDDHLRAEPRLLRFLESQGEVAAVTKAASYLLWAEGFRQIREYLLGHMVFMVSDSTGIPPADAARAGFTQETYGRFAGPYLAARKVTADEFRRLWSEQPYRPLNFRFGYPDSSLQNHLVITTRKDASSAR
jgi:hypothetical protein